MPFVKGTLLSLPENDKRLPAAAQRLDAKKASQVEWSSLPACPIAGFTLRECGLYDIEAKAPLTHNEMRMLINELASLESTALQRSEKRLTPTGVQRLNDATLLIAPYICFAAGTFWGPYKTRQAYDSATPQRSILIRWWWKYRKTPAELELMCARRSVLLNLTNLRVAFFIGTGALGYGLAAFFWPYRRGEGWYDAASREELRYFRHVEDALKWTFTVYHCHPAYAAVSNAAEQPSGPTAKTSMALPPVNLQRRRVGKLREGDD